MRAERRAGQRQVVPVDGVPQEVGGNVFPAEARRVGVAAVDNAADRDVAATEVLVRNVVEIAVGEWVMQRAVLAERLPVAAALNAVQHGKTADVGAVEQIAMAVEVEAPRVAAALAEELELVRQRLVAP